MIRSLARFFFYFSCPHKSEHPKCQEVIWIRIKNQIAQFNRINLFDNTAWQTGMFTGLEEPNKEVYKRNIYLFHCLSKWNLTRQVPTETASKKKLLNINYR